jgi:hypothetical protein
MAKNKPAIKYLLCVKNESYPVSLELRKVYCALQDAEAAAWNFVRVIDESDEDFLYPADCFVAIDLPQAAMGVFVDASWTAPMRRVCNMHGGDCGLSEERS